jgi:hypothetical protein
MTDTTMRLWKKFEATDPAHTKKVEFGRKFTSIDAHWQIMRVTEVLGPIGQGWGYHTNHMVERLHDCVPNLVLAMCDVTIWWREDGKDDHFYGPIRGTSPLVENDKSGKPRYDDDAPKKAMTDALTKGLSHLGVSADVFLGLFDDNKYVQRIASKFAAEAAASAPDLPLAVTIILEKQKELAAGKDTDPLDALWKNSVEAMKAMSKPHQDLLVLKFKETKAAIVKNGLGLAA